VRAQILGTPSREVARSEKENSRWIRIAGGPLDPHVGSCIGASREKAREFGHGGRELREAIPRQLEDSVGHSEAGEWNTGGTKPRDLAARSPEVLALGFASREVPRDEVRVVAWQSIRWDRVDRRVDTRCLEIGVDTPLNSRISGVRGIGG
jgi:hypothetical protein